MRHFRRTSKESGRPSKTKKNRTRSSQNSWRNARKRPKSYRTLRTRDEVVKNLERRLVNAKKLIAELRAEMQELQRRGQPAPQEDQPTQQPQQTDSRVSAHSLASIHDRYDQVLQCMRENKCSMACAFRLASCPRSTLRDFVAIAKLKKVDSKELDLVLRDQVGSVRALEVVCRKRLRRYIPVMNNMRREGQLENREKTFKFVITFHQQATDRLPTSYRHITNCRPTVGRQVAYISGKICWPSDGRLSANSRPTVGRHTADSRPTVGRLSVDRRPTVDRQSTDRFFGEVFFTITK
ncbi:unnamed protein product [Porites lobata]|uniref:Uncharacterized protein n=1 Tax=Porites lobata TaxID=104759 RepID=A0ABN8MQQ2_9CNID|nr:unnamed protein product [Porites lobata]